MSASPLIGLRWTIKRSFLEYIGRAPGGRCQLSDGAVATELKEIVFGPELGSMPASGQVDTVYDFRGAATFSAYSGALLVKIANPSVAIGGGHGELTILNPFQPHARLRLATFDIVEHLMADGFEHWAAANVRLAPEGCEIFNNVYSASERFEPLTIILPAGAFPRRGVTTSTPG